MLLSAAGRRVRIYNEANWKREFGECERSLDPVATAWLVRNSLLSMSESRWEFEGAIEQDVTELYLMPTTWFSGIFLGLRHAGRVDRSASCWQCPVSPTFSTRNRSRRRQ